MICKKCNETKTVFPTKKENICIDCINRHWEYKKNQINNNFNYGPLKNMFKKNNE